MEHRSDFLSILHSDVSSKILTSLDDPADIVRASCVSRAWRDFVITNGICKHLCLRLFPQLSGIISRVVDASNKQEKCADVGCSRFVELEHLKKEHKAFVSLARGLTTSEVGECLSDAISASSTDNYPEESIRNTLESRDRIGRTASYWSSTGEIHPEVPERLTYKLISDLCIITEINIQPFQAFFQPNMPIYSAKAVRFRMGHRILSDEEDDVKLHVGPQFAEEKLVWTYTSEEFPMVQVSCIDSLSNAEPDCHPWAFAENRLQNFKLREPVLCVGGFLQIELLGRVQKQEMDELFYICVAHVQVMGRSLPPVFKVETLDPNGRFALLYNPNVQLSSPRSLNEEGDEITVTSEMVRRHVSGWEQILNMLRGTLGVEAYDSDDEHQDSDDGMAEEFAL